MKRLLWLAPALLLLGWGPWGSPVGIYSFLDAGIVGVATQINLGQNDAGFVPGNQPGLIAQLGADGINSTFQFGNYQASLNNPSNQYFAIYGGTLGGATNYWGLGDYAGTVAYLNGSTSSNLAVAGAVQLACTAGLCDAPALSVNTDSTHLVPTDTATTSQEHIEHGHVVLAAGTPVTVVLNKTYSAQPDCACSPDSIVSLGFVQEECLVQYDGGLCTSRAQPGVTCYGQINIETTTATDAGWTCIGPY
jgi:hypothetical protein